MKSRALLKALHIFGVFSANTSLQCFSEFRDGAWGFAELQGGSSDFLQRGTGGCALIIGVSRCSASLGKRMPSCWKGGPNQLSNLRSRRTKVLVMVQWTSLQGYSEEGGGRRSLPIQSASVLSLPGESCGACCRRTGCFCPYITGAGAILDCYDHEGAEPEGKAFYLPVDLQSCPHPRSRALGRDCRQKRLK